MSQHRVHPLTATLIKQCHEKSGLEQAEFIKHHDIPVSQETFIRWEAGKIAVPIGILLLLNLITPVTQVRETNAPNQQQ